MLLSRDADVFFDEAVVGAEETWHEEVKEAPELIQRIFDRRTR